MKNKKILSVVLTVVMLLSLLPVNVFAAKRNEPIASGSLVLSETHMGKTVTGAIPQGLPEIKTAAATYKFYDNLTDFQKRIYNEFLATEGALGQNVKVVCSESELDIFDTEAIATNVYYALAAFFEDNPEYYWLLYAPLQFNITGQGSDYILELKLDYTVIPYSNEAEIRTEYNKTMQAVENFPVSGSTRYEKVKSINDGLCKLATYADLSGEVSDKLFFPSSCLLPPYETVCDGYSKAFKLICDRENIPCIIVCGYGYVYNMSGELEPGGHAWNYVQMEDGKWYAVDVTWNDSAYDAGVYEYAYDYFLIGRNSIDSAGDRFAVTHDPVGDRFAVYDDYGNEKPICLIYPALSESEYDPNAIVDPIPDNPGTDVVADVNGDGKLSVVDAKWILQSLAGLRNLNSAQDSAADVNGDGKLSVVDAKWILQALAGLRELGNVSPQPAPHIVEMYPELTDVPNLGSYFGINHIDKVYYDYEGNEITSYDPNGAVEYYYSLSEINAKGSVDEYVSILEQNGFVYDEYYEDEGFHYDYYLKDEVYIGVTICSYNTGEMSVYFYTYAPLYDESYAEFADVPSLGAYFGIDYINKVYYDYDGNEITSYDPNGAVEYYYNLSDIEANGSVDEYISILEQNGFVYDKYYEDEGFHYDYYLNDEVYIGVTLCYYDNGEMSVYIYNYTL